MPWKRFPHTRWRHQMETFSALLAICAGNSPVPGGFPAKRPVTRSFDVFFDLRLNKRLSKQSWGWWFETLPRPLWRHSNELAPTGSHRIPTCCAYNFEALFEVRLVIGFFRSLKYRNSILKFRQFISNTGVGRQKSGNSSWNDDSHMVFTVHKNS